MISLLKLFRRRSALSLHRFIQNGAGPRAVGLHGVWVNGRRILAEDGSLIPGDTLPGKVLKRFAA